MLNSSRDKNVSQVPQLPYWGRGKKILLCDPGSELRLRREQDKKREDDTREWKKLFLTLSGLDELDYSMP